MKAARHCQRSSAMCHSGPIDPEVLFIRPKKLQRLVSLIKTLCSPDKKLFFDTTVVESGGIKPYRALGCNYHRVFTSKFTSICEIET